MSVSGKHLRDHVLTPFDDSSISAEKGLASGSESLLQITDAHPQAALSALARLDLPFSIQNFLVQSLPSALRGLNGDFDPMRASGIASAGQQSSRCRKSVPSLRQCAGVPASMGLCKRRAKPESGPRETGRRRSNEGNRSSEGNSSASQGRHPSSCPTSPACKQPNMQPIPSALHAVNPGSPTGSPTISQSRQRMLGLQVRSMSA